MLGTKLSTKDLNQQSRDDRFLQKLDHAIYSNITNDQFGVKQLAEIMAMSRTQLYRRLHRLSGKNVSQYIREYRLSRALELLKSNVASAAEIAYQMGFSSPSYFNKCFHDQYGITPGEVLKNNSSDLEWLDSSTLRKKNIRNNNGDLRRYFYLFLPNKKRIPVFLSGLLILLIAFITFLLKINPNNSSGIIKDEIQLAVLPFKNIGEEENGYLARGISQEIRVYLQDIQNLSVYAGMDVQHLVDKGLDKNEIGKELGVNYILEGSVWKQDNRFKLWIVLSDINSDKILFKDNIDEEYESIMDVVSKVALNIVNSIDIVLTDGEKEGIQRQPTNSIEAYDLLMKAWENWKKAWTHRLEEGPKTPKRDLYFSKAENLAKTALEYDPDYLASYLFLANLEMNRGNFDSAKLMVEQLRDKFPNRNYGHILLGDIYYWGYRDYDKALIEYKNEINVNPKCDWAYNQIGHILFYVKNDYINGMRYIRKVAEMPPQPPVAFPPQGIAIEAYQALGDFEKSLEYEYKRLKLSTECRYLTSICKTFIYKGEHEKAISFLDSICGISECEDCNKVYFRSYILMKDTLKTIQMFESGQFGNPSIYPDDSLLILSWLGEKDEVNQITQNRIDVIYENKELYGSSDKDIGFDLACYSAILNDQETAIEWLKKYEIEELIPRLNYLKFGWEFTDLQNNAEFKQIINRVSKKREICWQELEKWRKKKL